MTSISQKAMTRRHLLRGAALGAFGAAGAAVLAACGETQVVTKEVIKEVQVETVVTKEVIKEVPVEKIVTQEVIKEVPVERLVTTEVVKEVDVVREVEKIVTQIVEVEKIVTEEVMIPDGPISGGTLTLSASRANTQDIFTPLRAVSSTQGFVFGYVYEGAVGWRHLGHRRDAEQVTGSWDPALANRWDEVEQGRSYIFHLNPDIMVA